MPGRRLRVFTRFGSPPNDPPRLPFILSPFPRVQPDFRAVCLPTTPRAWLPGSLPGAAALPGDAFSVSGAGEADPESGGLAGHENCECSNLRGYAPWIIPRFSTEDQRRALKIAAKIVVNLLGGGREAARLTVVDPSMLSLYGAVHEADRHMRLDVALDLAPGGR